MALASSLGAQRADCSGPSVRISILPVAFTIDSMPGWAFDCNAGRADTLLVVFYPRSGSRLAGGALLYANLLTPDSPHPVSVDDAVAADVARRRRWTPDLTVFARRTLRTAAGAPVIVREFRSQTKGSFELVGYIANSDVIVLLGLRGRTQAAFEGALGDFDRFVQAFRPDSVVRPP